MSPEPIRHRRTIRLSAYDYASPGAYFVTLVTAARVCLFGDVVDDRVRLSSTGAIVEEEWRKTAELRESVELDKFVVMPNHVHGVLWILAELGAPAAGTPPRAPISRRFGQSVPRSLSTIINNFKGRVTIRARERSGSPDQIVWQRGFFERVIRDEAELRGIREYIVANPRLWFEDQEHPAHGRL